MLGLAYSFLLYRKDKKLVEFPTWMIRSLSVLRFITVTILSFLLLSPLIKYVTRQIEDPIFIIAQDNSSSMLLTADSISVKNELTEQLLQLESELGKNFQVEFYHFGEKVTKATSEASYEDRFTNFEELFQDIQNRYENRNVGAMLLVSDGIYNRGLNPLYHSDGSSFPIYTLAKGDTNQRKDILISNLISNKIAFLGNEFPIKVEYKAIKVGGQKVQVKLFHKERLLKSQEVLIEKELEFGEVEFLIKAEQSGLQTYQVRISPIENENSLSNNYQNLYIEVLDSRQKILLAYQSPHPDIAAIQSSITSSENYKLFVQQIDEVDQNLKGFDLLILHGLPKANYPEFEAFIQKIRKLDLPILFFVDQPNSGNLLKKLNLPIQAANAIQSLNEVYPIYETAFPLFKFNDEQLNALKAYPPLKLAQGNYSVKDRAYILLRQQIGSVPTKLPLLAFSQEEKRKEGVFIGEGLWRWRMDNYSRFGNHNQFDQLITKMVQYLSVKADKSYFRISHEKEILENEKLRFDLQLFNKAYDPINDPDAFLVIQDENGNQFDYQFNKTSDAYFLELSGLNIGNYTYKAYTNYDQQRLEESGRFSIREIKIEGVQLVANHNLLFQLSEKSGGRLMYKMDPSAFEEELNNREDISSVSYTTEEVEDIINLKWIFFVLVFLLSIEWFVRKYKGAY